MEKRQENARKAEMNVIKYQDKLKVNKQESYTTEKNNSIHANIGANRSKWRRLL